MVKSKIPATRSQDQRSLQQFFSTSFRPPQKRRIDDVVDNDVPPIQATSAPWHPPRMHSSTQVQNPDSVGVLLPALSTTLQSVIPDANLASCDEALTRPGSTLVSATESASNDRLQSDKAYDEPDEIDRLYAYYRSRSSKMYLRCCIRGLMCPWWAESMRAHAIAELDSYAGSQGVTMSRLSQSLIGVEVSMIDNKCLVRRKINPKIEYDYRKFSISCKEHGKCHTWSIQRGFFDAILLSRFDHLVPTGIEHKLVHLLLGGLEASHICHNKSCSDPFHVELESAAMNKARNACRPPFARPCTHAIRCRTELIWPADVSLAAVKTQCDQARVDVVKPGWRCSKGCRCSKGWSIFRKLDHWIGGCPKGGVWIRA